MLWAVPNGDAWVVDVSGREQALMQSLVTDACCSPGLSCVCAAALSFLTAASAQLDLSTEDEDGRLRGSLEVTGELEEATGLMLKPLRGAEL